MKDPLSVALGEAVPGLGAVLRDAPRREHVIRDYDLGHASPPDLAVRFADIPALVGAGERTFGGLSGSAAAFVARAFRDERRVPVLVVPDDEDAERAADDLAFVLGEGATVRSLVPNDASPYAEVNPDRRSRELRLSTLDHLASDRTVDAIVVSAVALVRRVPPRALVRSSQITIRVDDELDRDTLVRGLTASGYARAPVVEDPGTFAVRGAIIDGWASGSPTPVRIECFGDGVLSIKRFDPETQRSLEEVREVTFGLFRDAPITDLLREAAKRRLVDLCDSLDMPTAKARALIEDVTSGRTFFGSDGFTPAFTPLAPVFEYLPDGAPLLFENPSACRAAIDAALRDAERMFESKGREAAFPVSAFFLEPAALQIELDGRTCVDLGSSPEATAYGVETKTAFTFDNAMLALRVREAQKRGKDEAFTPVLEELAHLHRLGFATTVITRTETQRDRLASLLSHNIGADFPKEAHDAISLVRGTLSRGLVVPLDRVAFITEDEIFGTRGRAKPRTRRTERAATGARAFVEDLKTLAVGDLVVHIEHGIGRYGGLIHKDVGGMMVDLLLVEYAGSDRLYLPVYRLNQIQKYSGGDGSPRLDRLGGQSFAKTKARAAREVRQMADELLRLFAERKNAERPPFDPPDDTFRAFEATFPFEETKDQARAILDVEADLERTMPMDRLVCGDVGFGKTEVAIRAAFRAALAGRQVAVLCPTTILAQQHYLNFAARMQNHPIEVRALSRFTKKADEAELLRRTKEGSVDIVIGTHRLLSKDVFWKRLGLLVVDEEQRFGVTHKERIKQLRTNIDVLTLTATPIPRTLQMAVSGLRDMSVITTPPVDRRAIRTVITRDDPAVVREAVLRELERGGQVFYVYNRIADLHERAHRLQELVPAARIAVAHGQMSEAALEQTMVDFVEGQYDVLCTTAIVESGLDIPRANTIIIDRADMFGLAQLYQLRGRVGRARERAYAYLVVPPVDRMSDEAKQRVVAIEQHSELGSGFRIASLDLELRGAGDLLGADQSGTASTIGFELFCSMLEDAVRELQGQAPRAEIDPEISVDDEALLPEDYIDDVGVRLSLYKRLASADGEGEVIEIGSEMEERFGPPPLAAKRFLSLMRLKTELRAMRALGLEATKKSATLHISDDTPLDIEKVLALVSKKGSPYRMTPDMRLTRRTLENEDLRSGLESADRLLGDLARCLKPS